MTTAPSRESTSGRGTETAPLELLDRLILGTDRDMPLHAQVRRALRRLIDEHFVEGQKFFTEPQLIERLKVSQATVRRALLDLSRDGLLERRVAKGSFVRKSNRDGGKRFTVHGIVPEWNSEFLMTMLETLSAQCRQHGFEIHLHYTHKGDKAADIFRAIAVGEGDAGNHGVVLLANEIRPTVELYNALSERGIRVVNIDSLIPGYRGPFVGTSNRDVVEIGLDHLTGLGHRAIVFLINEPEEHGNVVERTQMFEQAIAARGLTEARVVHCGVRFFEGSYEAAYRKMPDVMNAGPVTAIFAMSDPGAWGAIKWLRENGIKVPAQVSVLGFSDDRPSRYMHPALTTIAHPIEEIAARAIQELISTGPSEEPVFLTPKLIERESTGPAPGV